LALQTGPKHVFSKFIKRLRFLTVEDGLDRYTFTLPQRIARGAARPLRNPAALDD
jgi:hypothetical protein